MSPTTIFVVGATGTVGTAVSQYFVGQGWGVHATTRDLDSPAAKALAALGVKLFKGSWDDEDAIKEGLAGCSSLFINTSLAFDDAGEEVRRVKSILAAAKAAAVTGVVYSSVAGAGAPDELLKLDPNGILVPRVVASKRAIEAAVRGAGIPSWTILRPGIFASMFVLPKAVLYGLGGPGATWTSAYRADSHLPIIDERDIAVFAAAAFREPARFSGRAIDIASEKLYPAEIAAALSKAAGHDFTAEFLAEDQVEEEKKVNPLIEGQWNLRDMGQFVDLDEVKSFGLPLGSFAGFLERNEEAVKATYPPSA